MRYGAATDIHEYRGCWVFVEQSGENPTGCRSNSWVRERNWRETGNGPDCHRAGGFAGSLPQELISYGADRVLAADHPLLKEYRTEIYTDVIAGQVQEKKPEVLIVGPPHRRDLAPRLAFRLNTGCTADCTGLDIDTENRLFVSTRPASEETCWPRFSARTQTQMSTVRPGVMPCPRRTGQERKIIPLKVEIREETSGSKFSKPLRPQARHTH